VSTNAYISNLKVFKINTHHSLLLGYWCVCASQRMCFFLSEILCVSAVLFQMWWVRRHSPPPPTIPQVIYSFILFYSIDLCGLVVRVPAYGTQMYCVSCDVRTEFICYLEESRPPLWSSGQSFWLHNGDVLCLL
jgi:hypothetical protein